MNEGDALERAHALSAHASVLLRPSSISMSMLESAKKLYSEAADLFAESLTSTTDDGAKKTLQLLVHQNRKLVRDVERRMSATQPTIAAQGHEGSRSPPVSEQPIRSNGSKGLMVDPISPTGQGGPSSSYFASRLNPGMNVPPFSLRPSTMPLGPSRLTSAPPFTRQTLSTASSSHVPGARAGRASSITGTVPTSPNQPFDSHTLSPLVSSSSSDESYLNLGAVPDTMDPFSRFWGMLDNMLDNISNPVAFATAAVDLDLETGKEQDYENVPHERGAKEAVEPRVRKSSSKASLKQNADTAMTDSFYVVPKNGRVAESSSRRGEASEESRTSRASPPIKTPEELALENESLRASLDALAVHAQQLDRTNKALRAQHEGRERLMRSAVAGVRREAQKAKHGQDLIRSQLLASVSVPRPTSGMTSSEAEGESSTSAMRSRIRELEAELEAANVENDRKQAQIDKYKDRFERIRVKAGAKKEAKAKLEASGTKPQSGREGDLDEPG
ncbi:hypothetical protein BD324DRAFT_636344 [Kockovaella imperatae]|uniref:MIT domain-containing protein n=1 Tax=Kockovaella imperatae TaxID=4999 RepID=A0A1Y1UAL1_9TREE|nr:hypothetical protein BD324DRAFT_636344 [Kockovaella imperatae]ORX34547.1 hypothetical protein BD324DRAFT_636344 [Kockovaella imperatae]